MKRTKPMRRTSFKPKGWTPRPAKQITYTPRPRAVVSPLDNLPPARPVPKDGAIEHEGYRRLVAALPCIRCGIFNLSQAAHPNTGKGGGIKTDDRLCFPLCADGPGPREGCHTKFDQRALYTKDERRAIEPCWGQRTRLRIIANGQWPDDLPMLHGDLQTIDAISSTVEA